ncbi:hypothetical protein E2C01_001063 [Portunus trituberculatus]|uniref:Uncharacterized protein n=1 Tax=Portunus trituberculatus TaxID=210409 RepID=A0A5B7CG95_PORTR|nr:hypothetical protein [Portunus trituberculatus]
MEINNKRGAERKIVSQPSPNHSTSTPHSESAPKHTQSLLYIQSPNLKVKKVTSPRPINLNVQNPIRNPEFSHMSPQNPCHLSARPQGTIGGGFGAISATPAAPYCSYTAGEQ